MKAIGVDLGGTKILCRFVDPETGASKGRVKADTPKTGPADVLATIADLVEELDPQRSAEAVGVGVPGLVRRDGVVDRCPNIVGWDEPVAVRAQLRDRLGRFVAVGNDVNCGALAEHRVGAGRGVDDLLVVFVGTGVGGGLILDGTVRDGPRGMAGEIGHMTVVDGGRVCGCGGAGHLEAYAGRSGIEREARRLADTGVPVRLVELAGAGPIKSRHINRATEEGDDLTASLLDDASAALAIAIGNVATVLDLPRAVLGGGLVDKLGAPFVARIAESDGFGGFGPDTCELRVAHRLDDAGAVGAAILVADEMG